MSDPRGRGPLRLACVGLVWLALAGLLLGVGVARGLPLVWWPTEPETGRFARLFMFACLLGTVLTFHAGAVALALSGAAAVLRARRAAVVALVFGAACVASAAWSLVPRAPASDHRPELTVLSANLLVGNPTPERIVPQILAADADVVLLQEAFSPQWNAIEPLLRERYPYSVQRRGRQGAFAIFSRLPFVGEPIREADDGFGRPRVAATVLFDGRPLLVRNVHLPSPGVLTILPEQTRAAEALADEARTAGAPALLAGDFNSPHDAPTLRALRKAGLIEAHRAAGRGRGATWPRRTFLRRFPGVGIDHVYVTPELEPVRAEVGETFGSDHAPVIVRVRWREER